MRGWMMVVVMMNKKVKGNKITRNEDNIFLPSSAGSSVGGPITPGWTDEGGRSEERRRGQSHCSFSNRKNKKHSTVTGFILFVEEKSVCACTCVKVTKKHK